jgi:lipopolysaccharide export LptBFGC system permease protein LptF
MLIDRYIGRAMLHAFVIVFVSLAGLYVVFDAFTNMEEFITRSGGSGGMARLLARSPGWSGTTKSPPCWRRA